VSVCADRHRQVRAAVDRLRFLPAASGATPTPKKVLSARIPDENVTGLAPTFWSKVVLKKKKAPRSTGGESMEHCALGEARSTGLEPVTSGVTGRRAISDVHLLWGFTRTKTILESTSRQASKRGYLLAA
jgi:hypothetical protein